MRWGRVSLAQLQDEEFLIKQLRRLQSLDAFLRKRRYATSAPTDRGPRPSSSVFSTPLPLRLSLQARLARGPAPPPSTGDSRDADSQGVGKSSLKADASSEQEADEMNALYVLGSLDQPELTALMMRQLKDLLAYNCSFVDPFSTLVALRKHIVENVHAAVVAQHQQHQAEVEFTEKAMANSRLESASSASNCLSTEDSSAPGDALSIKPKEKGVREAAVGLRFVLSVLTSVLDASSGSPPQKREILSELLPLVLSLTPLSLAPKQPESHVAATGELSGAPAMASNRETRELVERLQQFFLHMCAGAVRQGPTSPKVLAVASSSDRDLTDRTQAMNGLIHLAAARASLRDFLLVLKVILGVSEASIGDYKDTPAPALPCACVQSPPALSSQLTSSAPLLKTTRYDQDSDLLAENNTPMGHKIGMMPDIVPKSTKPTRLGDGDPTNLVEATNLVQQVKRKALPKGFVPKVVGTTSSMTMINHAVALHPSGVHRLLSSTETIVDIVPTAPPRSKSRVKGDTRDLHSHGTLNLSFDLSTIQQDMVYRHGDHSSRFTRRDPVVEARCPKFKPLDVVSVLQELDHAKPCAYSRIASSRIRRTSQNNPEDCENRVAPFGGLVDEDSDDREVWSCGQNSYGELGHGDTTTRNTFERIESLQRKDVTQVSAGNEHSIVLCADGTVWTCGYNDNGQCGLGTTTRVVHMSEITKIGGQLIAQVHAYNGCEHTLLVTQDGKVATCGYNYRGQLGHGSTTSEPIPKIIRSLETKQVRLVSCSYYHTMMTCEGDGGRDIVYTFGRNDYGQLGHDDTVDRKVPQQVDALGDRRIVSVACGQYHSMVVTAAGRVFAFGKNDYGQLGLDTIDNQLVPAQIKGGLEKQTCLEIRCGYYHSIVLCSGARVYGFGRNDYGQLGLGRSSATAVANVQLQQQRFALPQLIEELEGKDITRIACGCYHTVVVCEDGMLYVFGRNNHGQLGTGDTNERLYPFPVDDFVGKHVATVAAGFYHTMVLTGNKEEVKCDDEKEFEDFTKALDLNGNAITHSSILSSASTRRILTGMTNPVDCDVLNNPTYDGEDDKRDEDDSVDDRKRNSCFPKRTSDDSHTHVESTQDENKQTLGGADSLEVAVIIMAELDRLCRPFIPKNGVYPIMQYPSTQVMKDVLQCRTSNSLPDICDLFGGCFELYAIDACSSTFSSLCLLLKYLSSRNFESLAHTQVISQGVASTSTSKKNAQLQHYMILVCLRLLQANLSQCLRSGCARAMLVHMHANEFISASTANNSELGKMIDALSHIRDALFMLIDKFRKESCLPFQNKNEYSNDETAVNIAEEATDTLMNAFELLFPCQCSQMKLLELATDSNAKSILQPESSESALCNYCKNIIWRSEVLPKYRKFLLTPLLKRLAEDSLMLKHLPTISLEISIPGTKQSLQFMYTTIMEHISFYFTRMLKTSESKFDHDQSYFKTWSSYDASVTLLLAIGKHVSSWASSCQEWNVIFKIVDEVPLEDRLTRLVDRVLRVDETDLSLLPTPWHCFLDFASAIMTQCCDDILQVVSREPVPSPKFDNRTQSSAKHTSYKSSSLELMKLSIVEKLLPSLISSLLAFSGNALFAATLLPKTNSLLRLVDEFNRIYHGEHLFESEKLVAATISTSPPLSVPVNSRSNTSRANDVSDKFPYLAGISADIREKEISDTMALPWSFLLEKKLAKLAAEMVVTLVKGNPFFALNLVGSKRGEPVSSQLLSSSIFKGGLDPDFLRHSILKTQLDKNSKLTAESRIVRHFPFQQSGYNDTEPFSLILPPPGKEYRNRAVFPAEFSSDGSEEKYVMAFSVNSIREFLRFLASDIPALTNQDWAPTRKFLNWIRDHYKETDPTYRMLIRTRRMSQHNKAAASQLEINMEYAFFASLIYHYELSLTALHWSLRFDSSQFDSPRSLPPRIFVDLWRYVAELRRRFATKKTELKLAFPNAEKHIFRLQRTILERCQLLLLLKIPAYNMYTDGEFIAPHDPAILSTYEVTSDRSMKRHTTSTYTTAKLSFLTAYPKSRWRIVRMLFHVTMRWRSISKSTSCMENCLVPAQELLDFVTADEDMCGMSVINAVLIDPCRRASFSTRGFEYLCETLSIVSFKSIQVEILQYTTQSLVFSNRHAMHLSVPMESQYTGTFYSSLRSDALVDFLVQVTDMIVEQATHLLVSGGENDQIRFLCILLSCWGAHFDKNQFEFVSDTGILTVLQEISLAIENINSQASQSRNSGSMPVLGEKFDCASTIFVGNRTNSMSKSLDHLKVVLWTLFRYICVHFSAQHIRLNTSTQSDVICIPVHPVLSATFELLYHEIASMVQQFVGPFSSPFLTQWDDEVDSKVAGKHEEIAPRSIAKPYQTLYPNHTIITSDQTKHTKCLSETGFASPSTSTPDQAKLYEMCALLIPLASSSEGRFEFQVNGLRWLQVLWLAFLHTPTLGLQQAVLRVLRVILKLHTPQQLSTMLLSREDCNPASLLDWGFERNEDIFVQHIVRMIGFCVSQCPTFPADKSFIAEQEQRFPVVPAALVFANGVHGNTFSVETPSWTAYKPDRGHSFALGNELHELVHDLAVPDGDNDSWSSCIHRVLVRCLSIGVKTDYTCDNQLASVVRIGCGLATLADIKSLEMVGSLYCFSGRADTLRSGALVELAQSGELAYLINLVTNDNVRMNCELMNSVQFCHPLGASMLANVVIQTGNFSRNQHQSHRNDTLWFKQVMAYLSQLENQDRPQNAPVGSRYAQLNVNDIQPVLNQPSISVFFIQRGASEVSRDEVIDNLLQYVLKVGSKTFGPSSSLQSQISGKYLVQMQTYCLALKTLVRLTQEDHTAHSFLSNAFLNSTILEVGTSNDGIGMFTSLEEIERNLWIVRERVYNTFACLKDEGSAELEDCEIYHSGDVQRSQSDNAWISDEDAESSKEFEHIEVPYIDAIECNEEPCASGEDDTKDLHGETTDRDLVYTEREDEDADENEEEDEDEDEEDENDNDEADDADESRAEFVDELMLMGFPEEWCVLALKQTENDIVSASAWIVDNLEYLSRLQSSLDQQLDQGIDSPMCNEEDDIITGDDILDHVETNNLRPFSSIIALDETTPIHEVDTSNTEAVCSLSKYCEQVVPAVNDKEMGRKVFGEMYFPFEEGGFESNTKSSFMYSWRSGEIESQLPSNAKSACSGAQLVNDSVDFHESREHCRAQFMKEVSQMDLPDLVKLLQTYERAFVVLYARLYAVSIWAFTAPSLNQSKSINVGLPSGLSYESFFDLLKVVLLRGDRFLGSFNQAVKGDKDNISKLMECVIYHRLNVDFEEFSSAVIEFSIGELELAASAKAYEAYFWTQRDLKRVDSVVLEEPGVELVGWLVEKLFDDQVQMLPPHTVTKLLLRLRFCLKSSNLPLKFIILRTISRILRQQHRRGSNGDILRDGGLLLEDFIHAAKQRYTRELVQNRLLLSLYLQAYIEILHLISTYNKAVPDTSPKLYDNAQSILDPTIFRITHRNDLDSDSRPSLVFDRKRCRSSLLTISPDDLSVVYSGHEIWKTVFGTVCCSTGVTSWQIRIEKSSSSYLFVGVASHRASVDSFLGADEHSWGYIGDKALYYQRNRVKSYGEGFGEGDIIGVRVDSENGTLSFSKNGVDLGIAFENIVGEVYPAVSFHSRHQKVSMIQGIIERLPVSRNDDLATSQTIYQGSDCRGTSGIQNDAYTDECGSIEECLFVCEMLNWMVDKEVSLRPLLLRSAYDMTRQWLLGSKKYVTTRAKKPLWVDVTKEKCSLFGFQAKDRVRTPRGNGTVEGVAESRIWIDVDGEEGAWYFHPSKLRPLTILSVSSVSSPLNAVNAKADGSIRITDSALLTAKPDLSDSLGDLSYEQFAELILKMHWNLKIDRALLSLVNDHCDTSSVSPWNVSPSDLLAIIGSKNQELLSAVEAQFPNVNFTAQSLKTMCVVRMGFLRFFNAYFCRVISYFDMTWHYFSHKSSLLPCHLASKCRGSIFTSIKNELFSLLMEKTANAPKKADDDYDYPDDLPQLLINRPKAATAKCHPGSLKSLFLSIFGQAFDQLHFLPVKMIRMVYSHPMDDGQLRSFKVKFEGEGVDDYGGPYREFFSQFFADLQMLREAPGEDSSDTEQKSTDSAPTSCLLPFLIPSPNWRNGVGANREKFVLNAALLSETGNETMNVRLTAEKDLTERVTERQQVHAEMFHFFGQMLGTCLRTRVCVRLDLAISVWQQLVGEDSDADRDTSLQTLKEVDFPACTLWKSLHEMREQYKRYLSSSDSTQVCRDLHEQLAAMDLAFTTFLSDGREVELCAHGADKSVTMANLDEYLDAVLTERIREAQDVISIIKQGINTVLPVTALSLFTWQELEKRVCGVADVDVNLLRQNTEYDEDLSPGDEFVQRFWRVLESLEEEDKRAFLRFVWARSRLPVGAAQFHQKFKLQSLSPSSNRSGSEPLPTANANGNSTWMDSQLPKSHTCFFALQLPRYSSDEICRKQLLYAVRNCVEMDGDFRLADTEMTGWTDINPNDQLRF